MTTTMTIFFSSHHRHHQPSRQQFNYFSSLAFFMGFDGKRKTESFSHLFFAITGSFSAHSCQTSPDQNFLSWSFSKNFVNVLFCFAFSVFFLLFFLKYSWIEGRRYERYSISDIWIDRSNLFVQSLMKRKIDLQYQRDRHRSISLIFVLLSKHWIRRGNDRT